MFVILQYSVRIACIRLGIRAFVVTVTQIAIDGLPSRMQRTDDLAYFLKHHFDLSPASVSPPVALLRDCFFVACLVFDSFV
jgi:hypothetical protein